ncbi:helix-turn-helix transcriptional regulator [Chryseobacterium antibioticum]|uniref:Helix-turn-helix transcriptional regulator n=1 Tax=Chryseobacterium pyrolae TaxID=2987481 RepID=A0ABT2IMS8_9FLAO|nr:helix-turn-helix transcriptional regulator [Chryseobacterium pyrolae]MCT2409975.1 helix-turn-helix transcriptional regulator [Chryseobacterium pyrolae]
MNGIIYNTIEGLLPDKNFKVDIISQNIFAWMIGLIVAYHFFIFVKNEYQLNYIFKNLMNERIGMMALFLFITFFILPYVFTKELFVSRLLFLSLFVVFLFLFLFFIVNKKINTILNEQQFFLKIHAINGILSFSFFCGFPIVILIYGDNQLIEHTVYSAAIFITSIDYFLYSRRNKELQNLFSVDSLSKREKEVLLLILNNPEMKYPDLSDALNISEKTLSTHLSSIYKKTGLKSKSKIEEHNKILIRLISQ